MATAKRKRYGAEEIIGKLRESEVGLAQGQSVSQVVRKLGVSEQTYYRWRREYGGMKVNQAKRLKELERANGYIESFNGRLRDEYLNGERFDTLLEAQVLIEAWRNEYNRICPHSSLGYRSPAPEVVAGAPLLRDETLTLQVV